METTGGERVQIIATEAEWGSKARGTPTIEMGNVVQILKT